MILKSEKTPLKLFEYHEKFNNKDEIPTLDQLKEALGDTYNLWQSLEKFTHQHDHNSKSEWHFYGEKF
ncbi:DUF3788 family protein [Chryseobacterium daeguense]|uniref:DUF3788 family protein n=1 Tax=Chryseobacterium daeguense TaxID=412438 RepID=UPI0012DD58AB